MTEFVGSVGRPLRIAIYLRISTDELHQPFSLEAQELKLRAYVTSQDNWELATPPFIDQASGATTDRPALRRALNATRAGRFDVLLVYRVDRLSRSIRGLSEILAGLDDIGVAFRSAIEPFDTATSAGRMMVQMLVVFAEFERATIIDRVLNGMERKAARGQWHRADPHHPPLIAPEVFDEAEQILIARGDDHTHRGGARSDYLLAGLIYCARCGKRYLGTSARGRRYTYRYYTCFTRQRYGTTTCPAERLPTDQVEHRVLDSLLATLSATDLIDEALGDAHDDTITQRAAYTEELATVEREMIKTEDAINRYLTAFENNTMPETVCAPRVETRSRRASELRDRRDELGLLIDEAPASIKPSPEHLNALRDRIRHDTTTAMPATVQALMIAKIEVTSRQEISPTFRIPVTTDPARQPAEAGMHTQVRTSTGSVPPAGHHTDGNRSAGRDDGADPDLSSLRSHFGR